MKSRQSPPIYRLLWLLLLVPGLAMAQTPTLKAYVAEALANNLALQQQTLNLNRSLHLLQEARGRFFPTVDLEARYTRADGGRTIDLPLGDLLNPAYGTLNDLLTAQGQEPVFPTLQNEQISFLRTREQDTRLRIVQPLYQPQIRHGYHIQQHLVTSQEAAVAAYRSTLIRDVKTAYYGYLQAEQAVAIFAATDALVRENLRTNERLLSADEVTQDIVFRARAEVFDIEQQHAAAEKDRDLARAYFNFLLNRPLDTPIAAEASLDAVALADEPVALMLAALGTDDPLPELQSVAVQRRAELAQMDAAINASDRSVLLAQSAYRPGVALALDLGTQGSSYGFGKDQPYYLASVVLQWNLFNGGQTRARVQQARLQTDKLRTQQTELVRQIELQVQEAYDAVQVARRALQTANERADAARVAFRLTHRRYEEGMANQVTYLDGQTTLTRAELNLAVTQYDLLTRLAELEYAAALYPLNTAAVAVQ